MNDISEEDRAMIRSAAEPSEVPCNGCSACCRSVVAIQPERGDNPADYECAINIDTSAPNRARTFSLNRKPDGSCYALRNGRCTIWDKRPYICRAFDCRKLWVMLTRPERQRLIRDRYFSRDIFAAGKKRACTLPEADALRAAALRVGYGAMSIAFMDHRRGVKKDAPG